MPILDRYWWLRWLAALYIVAFVAQFADWAYTNPYSGVGNGCLTCLFWVVLASAAGFVVWLIVGGFQARVRRLRRLRAINGDPYAMQLARMGVDTARLQFVKLINARAAAKLEPRAAPPAAPLSSITQPALMLLWRWPTVWEDEGGTSYPRWRVLGVLLLPLATCGLISFTCGWLLGVLPGQLDFGRFLWAELPAVWLWPFIVVMVWRWPSKESIFLIPFRRSPFGLVANEEGVEERTRFGDRHFVRWAEARLLEVRMVKADNLEIGYEYILYSRRDAVRWSVDCLARQEIVRPEGILREEMEGRSRQLLDLIAARCGLVARTLNPKLQAAQQTPAPRGISQR